MQRYNKLWAAIVVGIIGVLVEAQLVTPEAGQQVSEALMQLWEAIRVTAVAVAVWAVPNKTT